MLNWRYSGERDCGRTGDNYGKGTVVDQKEDLKVISKAQLLCLT